MTRAPRAADDLDVARPSPARIYDYMLGGQRYSEADEMAAKRIIRAVPEIRDAAWANRGFHQRAAAWIARAGVTQFIDVGAGLPGVGNTHDVVQEACPGARVAYVDNDPVVACCSQQVLASRGSVSVTCGDLRDPASILDSDGVRELIDPALPTGLLMTAVLMFTSDADDPWRCVAELVAALAPGSCLSLSHLTADNKPPAAAESVRAAYDQATQHIHFRSRPQVARFFDGLQLVPPYPGARPELTFAGVWGAEDVQLADSEGSRWLYCGVGRRR